MRDVMLSKALKAMKLCPFHPLPEKISSWTRKHHQVSVVHEVAYGGFDHRFRCQVIHGVD